MRAGVLAVGIALLCVATSLAQEGSVYEELYAMEGGAEGLQQMTILSQRYNALYAEVLRRVEASVAAGSGNPFANWHSYPEFAALLQEYQSHVELFGISADAGDAAGMKAAMDGSNRSMAEINTMLMDFLGVDESGLAALIDGQELDYGVPNVAGSETGPGSQPDSQSETGALRFSTANTSIHGDTSTVDRLRFRLENIQALYDAIGTHAGNLNFELARRNAENLYSTLATTGEDAARLSGEFSFSVTITGLPTDEAMARYNELSEKREENHRFYQNIIRRIDGINDAIAEKDLALLNTVALAACESFISWRSLPEWYDMPGTFQDWYEQAQEQAGEIESHTDFIASLAEMRTALRRLKDEAMAYQEQLKLEMEELEPVVGLHAELEDAVSSLAWATYVRDG